MGEWRGNVKESKRTEREGEGREERG